jgi:hypothetical protein
MSKTKKDLQMEAMEGREQVARVIKDYTLAGHRVPQTRREFMNSGLIAMTGTLLAPTLTQLISSTAWGSECGGGSTTAFPAFINLQLNGGPALFANYLARGNGGDGIDYTLMGMGANPRMETMFANNAPFWVEPDASLPASGMVRGLKAVLGTADADILAKSAFIAVAAESIDDRITNPNDLSGLLRAAGVVGANLPHLLTGYGAFLSETIEQPVNQFQGAIIPSATMLKVESVASVANSLTFKGALGTNLSDARRERLLASIESLSKLQVEALANNPNSHESQKIFRDLINCATEKNKNVMAGAKKVDIYASDFPVPPGGKTVASIWAKNSVDNVDNNAEIRGKGLTTAVMNQVLERCGLVTVNCLRGYTGAATINLGGYDYHAPFYQRASANLKDRFFGNVIARILQTAKAYQRKVFIQVSSDGSVFTSPGTDPMKNWVNDFPKAGMNYIIAYDPTGSAPQTEGYSGKGGDFIDTPYQLNHFGTGVVNDPRFGGSALGVSQEHAVGSVDAQDICGAAIFLNYLNFAGRPDIIHTPAFAAVKKRLVDGAGGVDIFKYYTRIKA